MPAIVQNFQVADKLGLIVKYEIGQRWSFRDPCTGSIPGLAAVGGQFGPCAFWFSALIPDEDSDNLSKSFKTGIKEVGRLRIGKILRKNRWMSDEEKMIYLQFYNEIEFWSFNTVSNEIKWYYIIIDILEVLSFAEKRQNMEYR